jgi:hypothetical protein
VLVYVEKITNRLRYTFEFIFESQNIEFSLTDNYGKFLVEDTLKLNYSKIETGDIPSIFPSDLLFENHLRNYVIDKMKFQNEIIMSFDGTMDPVASVFFVLSRYEEYISDERDEHNRFSAFQSINYKFGWLNKLVCERWSKEVIKFIYLGNGKEFKFSPKPVTIVPTFDIDNAFAFKNKSIARRALSFSKDLANFNFKRIQDRRNVFKGKILDPYDTYAKIKEISNSYQVYIFWLLGDFGKFDKNLPFSNFQQQKLIRKLSGFANIGIHPSYQSQNNLFQLQIEIDRLKSIIDSEVTHSRNHFLKISLPETYDVLIKLDIQHDFTMGYADQPGFRSGTVRQHKWFDLNKNTVTDLTIHPFSYMDGTLNEYMKLSIDDALKVVQELFEETERFGGEFSFIWHNETINNKGKWEGWEKVLYYSLNLKK